MQAQQQGRGKNTAPPSKNVPKPKLKTLNLKNKVKVNVPKEFVEQVDYLCHKIATVEWSGILFYEIEGDVDDVKNLEVTLKYILPMHKGTGGSTEYDFDEVYVDFRMEHPEGLNWLAGHIHSHHNMGAYFSGTDDSEIHDNSEFHNFYLSVVVDNNLKMVGKLGFRGKMEADLNYICRTKGAGDYNIKLKADEEVLFMRECEMNVVLPEIDIDKSFRERVDKIIEEATTPVHQVGYYRGKPVGKGGYSDNGHGKKKSEPEQKKSGYGAHVKDAGSGSNYSDGRWPDDSYDPYAMYDSYDVDDDVDGGFTEPPDPDDTADIEEFVGFWLTGGDEVELGMDYEIALSLMDNSLDGTENDVFIEANLIESIRTSYVEFFKRTDTWGLRNVLLEVLHIIREYDSANAFPFTKTFIPAIVAYIQTLKEGVEND